MPFTLVQLTDPHVGARWNPDAADSLAAAVTAVSATLGGPADAVVVTGDIASTPTDGEYAAARAVLDRAEAPIYPLPGNHDDRELLRRHFDLAPGADGTISYAVELGPMRLVALDSTRPGSDSGQLDRPRLEWLEATLAADRSTPTLLATHHPPLVTGIPSMDMIGIPAEERRALEDVLAGHPQVQVIACGHVHRAVIGALGTVTVLVAPSTDMQLALKLARAELQFVPEPPCFVVHLLVEGRIVSHIQPFSAPRA